MQLKYYRKWCKTPINKTSLSFYIWISLSSYYFDLYMYLYLSDNQNLSLCSQIILMHEHNSLLELLLQLGKRLVLVSESGKNTHYYILK
jgi:hypothetical protein